MQFLFVWTLLTTLALSIWSLIDYLVTKWKWNGGVDMVSGKPWVFRRSASFGSREYVAYYCTTRPSRLVVAWYRIDWRRASDDPMWEPEHFRLGRLVIQLGPDGVYPTLFLRGVWTRPTRVFGPIWWYK